MFTSVTSRLIFWITATTALLFSLLASVRAFAGDAPQSDDITVMVVQYGDARRRAA